MNDAVRGVIVAHSSLAVGLAAAVRQIAGAGEDALQAVSNEGKGPDGVAEAIQAIAGDAPVILFTDLPSGSCAFAARKLARMRPGTGVISGVNLTLLLDFVFHREMPIGELVERLVEKGRTGISGTCSDQVAHADRAATS